MSCICISIFNGCLRRAFTIIWNSQNITKNMCQNSKSFMKQSSIWACSWRISDHCHHSIMNNFSFWLASLIATTINLLQIYTASIDIIKIRPILESFLCVFFCSFFVSLWLHTKTNRFEMFPHIQQLGASLFTFVWWLWMVQERWLESTCRTCREFQESEILEFM